jgi:hypothetical protein
MSKFQDSASTLHVAADDPACDNVNTEWPPFSREELGPAPLLWNKNQATPYDDKEGSVLFNDAVNHKKVTHRRWHRLIYVYGVSVGGMTL